MSHIEVTNISRYNARQDGRQQRRERRDHLQHFSGGPRYRGHHRWPEPSPVKTPLLPECTP